MYEVIDDEGVSIYDSRCSQEVRDTPDDSPPNSSGRGHESRIRMKKTQSMTAFLAEQEQEQE